LLYTKKRLTQKLNRLQIRYNRLKEQLQVEKEINNKNSEWKCMGKIEVDANHNMNPRAIFISRVQMKFWAGEALETVNCCASLKRRLIGAC
jgi:hypothetical protein